MVDLSKSLNFYSAEWKLIKMFLEEMKEKRVRQLIGSRDHDESNTLRGSIQVIDLILRSEQQAAADAAHRRLANE